MHDIPIPSSIPARYLPRPKTSTLVGGALAAVGAISFFVLLGSDPDRAWQHYVSNWLFFTSVTQGAVILCAVTVITKAKWNWSVRRISLALGSFLPISFLLLLPMLTLREGYFPWIELMATDEVVQRKAAYLNIPFLTIRNVLGASILFGLSLVFMYLALRPDMGPERQGDEEGNPSRSRWRARLSAGWRGREVEEAASWDKLKRLAPALVLAYAIVMSMFAIDWAMSLEPHWFSTLFPAWYFMGAFWGGIASTALVSVMLKWKSSFVNEHVSSYQLYDLGRGTFAFSVFWTYLFFSQYIVIWYGKLPWEQQWIVDRSLPEWGPLSLLTIVLCFIVPFASLIGRGPKSVPAWLGIVTTLVLTGQWLEMYLFVAPSLWEPGMPTFTIWQPLIGLGFLGVLILVVRRFLSTFPVIQVWQPAAEAEMFETELVHEGAAH
jgi:hypothetical protein